MARSKSDISNTAIRIFLQQVGTFYDQLRGFEPYRSNKSQLASVLQWFDSQCCYCGKTLTLESMGEDHLVPMNKECLGLHAWGNIVPSCKPCNDIKHFKNWEVFLRASCGVDAKLCELRVEKIRGFLAEFKYEPNLELQSIANNLYQDVGAVAMTLIDLRFKQAEAVIRQIQQRRQD